MEDPNVAALLAAWNTHLPYPNNDRYLPVYTGTENAGSGVTALGASITLRSDFAANPAATIAWEYRDLNFSGMFGLYASLGSGATITTSVPSSNGVTRHFYATATNAVGTSVRVLVAIVSGATTQRGGIFQALVHSQAAQTQLRVGASGAYKWQYNTSASGGTWIDGATNSPTYTPPAGAVRVRVEDTGVQSNGAGGSVTYSNICCLT